MDYTPTLQDIDYFQDGCYPSPTTAAFAALEGSPELAAHLTEVSAKFQNPHGDPEPWVKSVASLTPTALANATANQSFPDASLTLEWVHGYRGEDCRGNVRYTLTGEIVYPVAKLGIIYSPLEHRQRYMTGHTNEIVSLGVAPDGDTVATGEAGARPNLICWDVTSCKPLSIIAGLHAIAITQIAFSQSGERLASIGGDVGRTLVIYNWRVGLRMFSARSNILGSILGMSFVDDGPDSIAACGIGEPFACFWRREGVNIIRRRAAFGRRARRQPTLCLARCGDVVLSGQASGHLYVWHGRNCVQAFQAHRGSLNAVYVGKYGVLTGGKDGKVRQWSHTLNPGASFDLSELGMHPTIRSVCLSNDGTRLLVGTGGNEIYELSAVDGSDALGGPVTTSHFGRAMCSVACHPLKPEFASCGGDCTVRTWDIVTKCPVRTAKLAAPVGCVAYHPNGDLLASGFGCPSTANEAGMPQSKIGGFCVLNDSDLSVAFEAKDSTLPLVASQFSPDGEILAFASEDSSVYLYACGEEYESIGQCRRHSSPVRYIDFSSDSRWLRSCCDGGHLHFFNANSAQYQSNLSALKDIRWASETCLYGYGVAGSYIAAKQDGAILTACARAQGDNGEGPETGGGFILVGDSYGRIRLTRFPSRHDAAFLEWRGHAGSVVAMSLDSDETHLLTGGRDDRCVMQWALGEDERGLEDADDRDEDEVEDYAPELRDCSDFQRHEDVETAVDLINERPLAAELRMCNEVEQTLELAGNAESNSLIPPYSHDPWFLGISMPPSQQSELHMGAAPTDAVILSRVFGYSCEASRNNAKYTACGAVVYPAGATVVRVDVGSGGQSFGTFHAGSEICALAISKDRLMLATSDISAEPKIALWVALNVAEGPSRVIRGPHLNAITLLAFDDDKGKTLVSLGADDRHMVAVHDVTSGYLLFMSSTTCRKPFDVAFGNFGSEIVIVGIKYVLFFTFLANHAATRHASASFGRIGRLGTIQSYLSCAYLPNATCVVGTADGHLYVFEGSSRELAKSIKAHDGFIYSMDAPWHRAEQVRAIVLVTGARDGDVKLWNGALEIISKFDNRGAGPIRSVFTSADSSRILVGSQAAAQLREFRTSDGVPTSVALAGGGAAAGELWGLAPHPVEKCVATASDDGALAVWNIEAPDVRDARRYLTMLAGACRALAYSPDGKLIASCLGGPRQEAMTLDWARKRRDFLDDEATKKVRGDVDTSFKFASAKVDGTLQLIRSGTGALVHEFTDAHEWLREVRFSPDGQTLVAGGTDGRVHVYLSDEHGQFSCTTSMVLSNGAAICAIDFTVDGRHIQVADEARTLVYGDLRVGVSVTDPSTLQNARWATFSCLFGWATVGVHAVLANPEGGGYETSSIDVHGDNKTVLSLVCLARSNSAKVVAVGDHHGVLRLLQYPATSATESSAERVGVAHVGTLRRLAWTDHDSHLVTVGGLDRNICVWRFVPDSADSIYNYTIGANQTAQDYDDAIDADGGRAMATAIERAFKATVYHFDAKRKSPRARDDKQHNITAWMSVLTPPSNLEDENPALPQILVTLDCAHGQRSDDIRGCAAYNSQGGIVYACGGLGVVYDARTHSQCFHFHHHKGGAPDFDISEKGDIKKSALADICSLAITVDGHFAASGDQGKFPRVRVWDALTGNTISVLPRHLRCGVLLLSFSKNGRHLAAIGGDKDHSYSLYVTRSGGWEDGTRVAVGSGMRSRVHCAAFVGYTSYPLFVGACDTVEFIRLAAAGGIRRQRGVFNEQRCPKMAILCVVRGHPVSTDIGCGVENNGLDTNFDSFALTGTGAGSLYLWIGKEVGEHVPNAHNGPVYAIAKAQKRIMYATAGRDGVVKTWNNRLQTLQSFELANMKISILIPIAASLCFGGQHETRLLFITRSGEMCELATSFGCAVLLTEAHARRKKQATEAQGLDVNPESSDVYATSGDDGSVRIWSCLLKRCVMRASPDTFGGAAARCCSWAPNGVQLAVGLGGDPMDKARDGTLVMLRIQAGVARQRLCHIVGTKFLLTVRAA